MASARQRKLDVEYMRVRRESGKSRGDMDGDGNRQVVARSRAVNIWCFASGLRSEGYLSTRACACAAMGKFELHIYAKLSRAGKMCRM